MPATPNEPELETAFVETARRFESRISTANLPVYRASTVLFDNLAQARERGRESATGARHASTYGTVGTPTTFALMDALAEIEGRGHECRAAIMPSGLAAITTALLAFLEPGDEVLMSDSVYGPARNFAQGMMTKLGIRPVFFAPTANADEVAALITPATKVLYLESPGSYTFELQDMRALCAMARSRGLISMVDNAWASPAFARPFDWGVDVSLLPLTKYWSGHSDVLMGAIVVREAHWLPVYRAVRELGLCVGGDDAFLILRGLRTAQVRMRQHEKGALAVARWLQQQPEVLSVLHPGLPEHPQHELFKRDFSGSSGLFSFELDPRFDENAIAALVDHRAHFGIGYSWGGYESLIMPASIGSLRTIKPWEGGPLVRLHIGLESPDDLIADLGQGFEAMRKAST
ncbi:MAG: cystathionine beta-lyase [Burkholderiaceae bacterium]